MSVAALLGFFIGSSLAPRLLAFAQQPAFDVVSINRTTPPRAEQAKPGRTAAASCDLRREGLSERKLPARRIILAAYRLTDHQLSGGPGWLDNDKFDLEAKAAMPANEDRLRLMLQTMLAERFKLVARHENKELPVYALTVGKNGPKLPDVKPDDAGFVKMPAGQGNAGGNILVTRASMQDFAFLLSGDPSIDRPVLDKTGLQGVHVLPLPLGSRTRTS